MSEIKVNKVTPRVACGTTQLGDSGDTITIPSGATITNLGTATGFGGTGVVSWETSSIKTSGFTAVTGTGYFCNTTSGGFTVTLPASPSAGDVVGVSDYAKTWDTGNLTLGRNSEKIGGDADDAVMSTEGLAVTLVYVDSTKGWIVTDSGLQSDAPGPLFVAATGGCITTCGNYKMHTFLSPNTLIVTCAGNCAGSQTVDYLTVAGGGGGGPQHSGGGGAGGYRTSYCSPGTPLSVTATPYAITVGGGGAGGTYPPSQKGTPGTVSTFDTITSAGGGGGGNYNGGAGLSGGSGGGGGTDGGTGGAGNIPAIPVGVQGYTGGDAAPSHHPAPGGGGGGGGGAAALGTAGSGPIGAGPGGAGAQNNIDTNNYYWAGGGGGGMYESPGTGGNGGIGGGGGGGSRVSAAGAGGGSAINAGAAGSQGGPSGNEGGAGGDNSGGGGGGSGTGCSGGAAGGSGVVIIRYKYQ